jgi:hypothetical protein
MLHSILKLKWFPVLLGLPCRQMFPNMFLRNAHHVLKLIDALNLLQLIEELFGSFLFLLWQLFYPLLGFGNLDFSNLSFRLVSLLAPRPEFFFLRFDFLDRTCLLSTFYLPCIG